MGVDATFQAETYLHLRSGTRHTGAQNVQWLKGSHFSIAVRKKSVLC